MLVAGRIGKLSLSVLSADRRPSGALGGALGGEVQAASSPAPALFRCRGARAHESVRPVGAGVTWAGDVSPALGSGAARSAPSKVQVFQGSAESKEYHF